tara:strand:- start:2178 stop:4337 length:2160 start_codon:yes stop_codon:yes gene_type:complete
MGIFDRLGNFFRNTTETKEAPTVMYNSVGSGYSRKDRYDDYAREGYQQNAIVYRCVNEIAQGASSVHFKLFDGDIEIDNHPIIELLKRPSPQFAGVEFFHAMYSHLLLAGNSYIVKTMVNSKPTEMHILRPDRMKVVPSKTHIPEAYEYMIEGKVANRWEADPDTGTSEVKHFKLWHPLNDYYGLSPLSAGAVDVDQHNMSAKHNYNLLANGARPSGAVIFKPKDESGMSLQLTEGQRQQLMTDLDLRFAGSKNAGRTMLLEGDFDWKEMGLSPRDMDFLQMKNMTARDIALCFGVPSQLVGVPDSQTYNNVSEARLALYEDTIIPLLRRVESDLNEWLSIDFNENIKIVYDIDSIPAMAERRKRTYENVTQAVREGIITRNEARERLGYEKIEGGDEVYIQATLFPLGGAVESDQEKEPEEVSKDIYGDKEEIRKDVFTTVAEAEERAEEIGCFGTHFHENDDGEKVFMPCASHADYLRLTGEELKDEKAIADVNTTPTDAMAKEAKLGLEWRREFKRGGTSIGVARANQLVRKERLSPRTVRRMFSFFARHEVDKQAEGFSRGEDGYPSAGRIAWALWGGDAGFSWSRAKARQLDNAEKSEEFHIDFDIEIEEKVAVSKAVEQGLKKKVDDHNEKHGDKKGKKVTLGMLKRVFVRGIGAYRTNPQSVRPNVRSEEQWAYARVNAFLVAVRTGKYRSGKFDRDLLPSGHPLKSDKKIG